MFAELKFNLIDLNQVNKSLETSDTYIIQQEILNYKIEVSGKIHSISDQKVIFERIVKLSNLELINLGADERQIHIVYSNVASKLKKGYVFYILSAN